MRRRREPRGSELERETSLYDVIFATPRRSQSLGRSASEGGGEGGGIEEEEEEEEEELRDVVVVEREEEEEEEGEEDKDVCV